MNSPKNRRILLIDDNESIHDDFKKILLPVEDKSANLSDMRAAFLCGGDPVENHSDDGATSEKESIEFEISSALQGEEGYKLLCDACDRGEPFSMAFVDMRMPPGWDGVQTIAKLWERDPDLQVVVCTAFSDYTWEETVSELGQSDQLLILKKPFDAIEIFQLAAALTEKWNSALAARTLLEEVQRAEMEARAYATSLETVNHSLVTAKAAANMAADMKTEFLVRLSSEVSCKLSEVLGNIELLGSPEGEKSEAWDQVEAVLDVGHHLMRTVTEILDVTTLETGDAELEVDECDPQEVSRTVLEKYADAAEAKGVALEVLSADFLPTSIQTEERHLRKVLETLVDNAVRHSEGGSVSVHISLSSTESWQRPRMLFEVKDSGPGIPHERLGSIFEPSARGESEARGYGFGLALAKRLAALLGGDLTARSEEGSGCVFSLVLEISSSATQQAA